MKEYPYKSGGFTLTELSIVLVIVGLIVAGIVGGQSFIRGAKIKSVIINSAKYQSAVLAFEDYYNALPGDMLNAACAAGSNCYWPDDSRFVGFSTENGNGNGQIYSSQDEGLPAWQQLSLAGMISGNYSGHMVTTVITLGENAPSSKFDGGGYILRHKDDSTVYGIKGNYIQFAAESSDNKLNNGLLSAPDAAAIDRKTDDGLANSGKTLGQNGVNSSNCVTSGVYDLDKSDERACRFYFLINKTGKYSF